MKTFIVNYESKNNLFKGTLCIQADCIENAQDKFLDWLKQQKTYQYLWSLNFEFSEIQGIL